MKAGLIPRFQIKNGVAIKTESSNLVFSKLKSASSYMLYYYYRENTNIINVSFPDLINIDRYGLNYAFFKCTEITSVFCSFKTEITRIGKPAVRLVEDNEAFVLINKLFCNFHAVVGSTVIYDKSLKILKGLIFNGIETFFKIFFYENIFVFK